jgi:uncharacterized protein YecE (DUF72 family)
MIRMNALITVPTPDDAAMMGHDPVRSETDRARALVEQLSASGRRTAAEVLEELRRAFPHSPLAVRVRALEALRRR